MNFLKPLYLHEDKPLSFWFKGEFFFLGGGCIWYWNLFPVNGNKHIEGGCWNLLSHPFDLGVHLKRISNMEREGVYGEAVWSVEMKLRGNYQSNRGTGFPTQKPNLIKLGMDSHDLKRQKRNRSQAEPRENLTLTAGEKSTFMGHT